MRTSGSGQASDYGLMLVPLAVAIFIVVAVFGGPREFVRLVDYHIRATVESVVNWAVK